MHTSRRVALIITGGTIDAVGQDRLDMGWYIEAGKRLAPGELAARVPEIVQVADVTEIPFRRIPSQAITTADWLELTRTIHDLFASDRADGVVVTHGTNTLEETAYFLHLTLKTERPVVLVGAMRPASAVSADGYLNMLNGIRVAAETASCGTGVLVVLNDAIYSARDVTKTATYRVEAFQGRDVGPLGYADVDGRVVYYHRPARLHTTQTVFDPSQITELPRVDLVVSHVGADGSLIDAAVAAAARGIVSAGTGAGRPTPGEDAALDRAAERGVLICRASRVGSGRTLRSPGLRQRGFVAADNLQPWKARILLALGLSKTSEAEEIQSYFDTY